MKVENRFSKTAIILLVCLGMLFMCAAPTFAETDASDETSKGAETTETTEATEATETIAPQTYIEGWRKDNIGWWYRNADGTYPASQWKAIKGYWYYFDEAGYMVQGWQYIGSKWYYFDESGAMVQGWQHIGSNWYYFDKSGYMTQGWQYLDGVWYYLGWPNDQDSGAMATGLREIDGRKYYFNPSGAMQRGRQSIDGIWYYFGFPEHPDTGAMRFGWIDDKENSSKYYAQEDGKLATGLFQMNEVELKRFLDATKEANLVEVSEESTEDLMQAYVPEDIEIYFDETGKFKQASEFEIDGEFYGADDSGKVFKYSNSELISGKIQARSYDDPLKVVTLVLNDLGSPAGVFPTLLFPTAIQVFHLDILIPRRPADAGQGQASLLRLKGRILLDNDRIIHDDIHDSHVHDNDLFPDTDHVGRHADTAVLTCPQSIHEILPDRQVLFGGRFGFLPQE